MMGCVERFGERGSGHSPPSPSALLRALPREAGKGRFASAWRIWFAGATRVASLRAGYKARRAPSAAC